MTNVIIDDNDSVIIRQTYNCWNCQREITREEWSRCAKMCQRCYNRDGDE